MSSQIFFGCPHAPCAHTATLTLDEFRQIGAPYCPEHQIQMVSPQSDGGAKKAAEAVGVIMTGVTQLAAVAMSYLPARKKDE